MDATLADTSMVQVAGLVRTATYLTSLGLDPEPVLRRAGVDPERLARPGDLVSLRTSAAVLLEASRAAADPAFGLHLARFSADARSYALIGYLFTRAPTLRAAFVELDRFYNAAVAAARFKLEFLPDRAKVSTRYGVDCPGLHLTRQESQAAIFLHARAMSGGDWTPLAVAVEERVDDPAPFRALYGVDVRDQADRDELVIPAAALDRPNPLADPLVFAHMIEAMETNVRLRREAGGAVADQLRLTGAVVDLKTGVVWRGDASEKLTVRERELLAYLARRANQVVSHAEIERDVWGLHEATVTFAPAVAIRRLRRKIEPDEKNPVNLVTEFGEGWRLRVPTG